MSIKDFKVIESLGKGSFATVYKVIRKSDGKMYALKRVKIGKMSKKEVSDALNEIRFLASIRHKNVVGFLEAFLENNETELCIVMEYCGCGDLSAKVERYKKRRQLIEEAVIWRYVIQSVKALEYLHAKGICHRDLKCANAFIAEDGSVKIGDMNVSKKFGKGAGGNLKTQIGTPYYMSPEIWQNKIYDVSCDIWSLGCMVYELCALRPPFLGNDLPGLKRSILSGRYPPIASKYSPELHHVVDQMLKLAPRQRPTAAEFLKLKEIKAYLHLDSESAMPTTREEEGGNLLKTIAVPKNMRQLSSALPKPCYPDARPDSPTSWTVAEQVTKDKSDQLYQANHQAHPAVEEFVRPLQPVVSVNEERQRLVRFDTKQEDRSPAVHKSPPPPAFVQVPAVRHDGRSNQERQADAYAEAQRQRRKAIAEDYLRRREEANKYKNRGQSQVPQENRIYQNANNGGGGGGYQQQYQQQYQQPRGFLPKI